MSYDGSGPYIYSVPAARDLTLAVATAAASPSESAALPFLFPTSRFIAGILMLPRAPIGGLTLQQTIARVAIRIVDENQKPVVIDSRSSLKGANNLQVAIGGLALGGSAFRWFPIQRPVRAGDQWTLFAQNDDPVNTIQLAGIFLYPEAP